MPTTAITTSIPPLGVLFAVFKVQETPSSGSSRALDTGSNWPPRNDHHGSRIPSRLELRSPELSHRTSEIQNRCFTHDDSRLYAPLHSPLPMPPQFAFFRPPPRLSICLSLCSLGILSLRCPSAIFPHAVTRFQFLITMYDSPISLSPPHYGHSEALPALSMILVVPRVHRTPDIATHVPDFLLYYILRFPIARYPRRIPAPLTQRDEVLVTQEMMIL